MKGGWEASASSRSGINEAWEKYCESERVGKISLPWKDGESS